MESILELSKMERFNSIRDQIGAVRRVILGYEHILSTPVIDDSLRQHARSSIKELSKWLILNKLEYAATYEIEIDNFAGKAVEGLTRGRETNALE